MSKLNENRLPAEQEGDFTRCCICFEYTKSPHWHHTVPRSLGGEYELQIPLDGDCHTTLHAKADAIVSYLKGNRKEPVGNYWMDKDAEKRAHPYLQILVRAMMDPPVDTEDKKILLGQQKVDLETRAQLEMLKRDLQGVTNLGQVVQYCIHFTLDNKGYKNEKQETNPDEPSSKRHNHRASDVWGMRGTKRRKFDKG